MSATLPPLDALSLACAAVAQLVDDLGPIAHVPDQALEVRWSAWPDRDVEHEGRTVHLPARYSVHADVVVSTHRSVFA